MSFRPNPAHGDDLRAQPDAGARSAVPVTSLRRGQIATIHGADLDERDDAMIRALGLRPTATVRLARCGEPCILCIRGVGGDACRIGLARPLADRLMVTPHDEA